MQEIIIVGRHPILSIAWIALLVAVLVTTFKSLTESEGDYRGEATRLINKEDAVVVICRQRDDFRSKPYRRFYQICCRAKSKVNNVGELEKHKDKPVIVVDGSACSAASPATR